MNEGEARRRWEELHERLDADARESKTSQQAVVELAGHYARLSPSERLVIDELLAEWAISDDEAKRFDALALISEHRIRSAVPALRQLANRLEETPTPAAPYEWAKVNRILGKLSE